MEGEMAGSASGMTEPGRGDGSDMSKGRVRAKRHTMLAGIREDIQLALERDPAATSAMSVWLYSPAMHAVWAYRRHHWLWTHGHKTLARLLATRSRRKFGVEIHPGATIGRRFIIDHGMGIVIGETTIIGDDCQLYQGVTLGGTGKETGKRHPTLGNNVLVGVNAVVLGNITIGDNAKIGGGTVVVHDVPANSTVVGPAGHVVKRRCVAGEWEPSQIGDVAQAQAPCGQDQDGCALHGTAPTRDGLGGKQPRTLLSTLDVRDDARADAAFDVEGGVPDRSGMTA